MKRSDYCRPALPLAATALLMLATVGPALSQASDSQSTTQTQTTTTTTQTTTNPDGTTQTTVAISTNPDRPHVRSIIADNYRQLRQYNWQSVVTTTVNGNVQNTETFDVTPGPDGRFQWKSVEHKEGGFANRKQEQDARHFRTKLQDLVASYREELQPSALEKFIESASYDSGTGDMAGTLRIKNTDIVQPGDQMIMWLTPDFRPKRLEIRTALDKYLVTATTEYTVLENGPSAPLRTTVQVPSKNAVMTIENSKFERYVDHHQP